MAGGVWQGTCMVGGMHGQGHVWQGSCMTAGVCGRVYVWWGGMHDRGHAWQGGHVWQERRPLYQTVRILLECILV